MTAFREASTRASDRKLPFPAEVTTSRCEVKALSSRTCSIAMSRTGWTVGCRLATNDPISEFSGNGFLQWPDQTSCDEVERCKRRSRQGNALSGSRGINCQRGLIEYRPSLGIGAINAECRQPVPPLPAAAVVDKNMS